MVTVDDAEELVLNELSVEEGVREMRRIIRDKIAEPLSRAHNLGLLKEGKHYIVTTEKASAEDRDEDNGMETKPVFAITGDIEK